MAGDACSSCILLSADANQQSTPQTQRDAKDQTLQVRSHTHTDVKMFLISLSMCQHDSIAEMLPDVPTANVPKDLPNQEPTVALVS